MQRRGWTRVALFVGVAAILGAVVWNALPHNRLLSRDGKLVISISGWKRPYWQWRSAHQILYLRDDLAPRMTGQYSVCSLDTTSGEAVTLSSINQKLRQDPIKPLDQLIGSCGWMEVSPDGNKLLWVKDPGPRPPWSWFTCTLDTSQFIKGPLTGPYIIRPGTWDPPMRRWVWMKDSKAWAALTPVAGSLHALVYRIEPPALIQDVTLKVTKSSLDANMPFPTTCFGFTDDRHLLAASWRPAQADHVSLFAFDLSASGLPVHESAIHLPIPPHSFVEEIVLSPQGDRLAWRFLCYREPPLQRLATWLPWLIAPGRWQNELWVSHLDGSSMQEIGFQPINNPNFPVDTSLDALRWTPEGAQLSYLYANKLYTVPSHAP